MPQSGLWLYRVHSTAPTPQVVGDQANFRPFIQSAQGRKLETNAFMKSLQAQNTLHRAGKRVFFLRVTPLCPTHPAISWSHHIFASRVLQFVPNLRSLMSRAPDFGSDLRSEARPLNPDKAPTTKRLETLRMLMRERNVDVYGMVGPAHHKDRY